MITLGIVGYYVLAFAILAAVTWLSVRQNVRDADRCYGEWAAALTAAPSVPPLAPWHQLPTTDPDDWSDLSADALEPIAPLLRRVMQEYVDHPAKREQLMRAIDDALVVIEPI